MLNNYDPDPELSARIVTSGSGSGCCSRRSRCATRDGPRPAAPPPRRWPGASAQRDEHLPERDVREGDGRALAVRNSSLADLVIVCANVPRCEGGAILACDDGGRVLFFSMATSFSSAALTAEGLGKACEMTIGNGFVPGHARLALDLVRSEPPLMKRFQA